MTHIAVSNLAVRFPVYGADSRSLKKHIAARTLGGRMMSRGGGVQVVEALAGLNLMLRPGDRLGLVGPNGAGKTTLLRCLAGAYDPSEGRLEVNGRVAALLDLSLGMDTQATGYDNIVLRGLLAGMSRREIRAKTPAIARFSGLGPYLHLPVKAYSAGMSARLAFAVITATEPDILLLDEWIAVGDRAFREAAHARLEALVDRAGIVVLASHDLSMIETYCNKVMRLEGGRASRVRPINEMAELLAA